MKKYKANTVGDDILKIAKMLSGRRMMNKDGLYEENRMPETILDDDIPDWEHDNLESK